METKRLALRPSLSLKKPSGQTKSFLRAVNWPRMIPHWSLIYVKQSIPSIISSTPSPSKSSTVKFCASLSYIGFNVQGYCSVAYTKEI